VSTCQRTFAQPGEGLIQFVSTYTGARTGG
jgi:hypothetical protein